MSEFLGWLMGGFRNAPSDADEQPLRGEIFSVERLEQYAKALAAEHITVTKKGRAQLLPRLEDNGRKLVAAYRTLVEAIRNGRTISPAAEWLVDNFHIVEEQLREIREDLPRSYYHELPKLADGELAGNPRIYALALALIAHTDCRLDTNTLRRFIAAYQTVDPLSIGELWAVAITLRLALVENLRRLAILIVKAREEREQADKLADKLLELASRQPSALIPLVAERLGKRERMPQTFVGQVTQRRRGQDPAGAYAKMEFTTRDRYRHVIERISKRTSSDELEIARTAVELAEQAAKPNHQPDNPAPAKIRPETHVGYYLVDSGLAQLES